MGLVPEHARFHRLRWLGQIVCSLGLLVMGCASPATSPAPGDQVGMEARAGANRQGANRQGANRQGISVVGMGTVEGEVVDLRITRITMANGQALSPWRVLAGGIWGGTPPALAGTAASLSACSRTRPLEGDRDCGWEFEAVGTCAPGAMVEVAAQAACGLGYCDLREPLLGGRGMLRVCPGDRACDTRGALAFVRDACDARCSPAVFRCPDSGTYNVLKAPLTTVGSLPTMVAEASVGRLPAYPLGGRALGGALIEASAKLRVDEDLDGDGRAPDLVPISPPLRIRIAAVCADQVDAQRFYYLPVLETAAGKQEMCASLPGSPTLDTADRLRCPQMADRAGGGKWARDYRWAVVIGRVWDEKGEMTETIAGVSGASTTATVACVGGTLAKCELLGGYVHWDIPWSSSSGDVTGGRWPALMKDAHASCSRMFTGDGCGEGIAFTFAGTLINHWDQLAPQVQIKHPGPEYSPQNGWLFEAAWNPGGAVCWSKARWQEQCAEIKQECPAKARQVCCLSGGRFETLPGAPGDGLPRVCDNPEEAAAVAQSWRERNPQLFNDSKIR